MLLQMHGQTSCFQVRFTCCKDAQRHINLIATSDTRHLHAATHTHTRPQRTKVLAAALAALAARSPQPLPNLVLISVALLQTVLEFKCAVTLQSFDAGQHNRPCPKLCSSVSPSCKSESVV